MRTKFIFVAGGVMSGVGKGIAAASVAQILEARGFRVTAVKIDPYVNVDAGTMNPVEHGEVFVLDDGAECDQDMGNYERFLNINLSGSNYMTTGSIYLEVIRKERNLEYGGKCVEVVPHIPLAVIDRIKTAALRNRSDIVVVEIGGTVGEYQNILFLEAVRILKQKQPQDVALILVSLLPTLDGGGNELKTKPTQYAVRTLNSAGLQPDFILARAKTTVDAKRKEKIAVNCNMDSVDIISAPNVDSIYTVPLNFEKEGLSRRLLQKLNLKAGSSRMSAWNSFLSRLKRAKRKIRIAVIGKYFATGGYTLTDSYISVLEAVKHAGAWEGCRPEMVWIDSEDYEKNNSAVRELRKYDGVIIPGGFGSRGVAGKIKAIRFCRENKIPYLGLCYGMQLAVIEFARSKAGLKEAQTTEVDPKTIEPVVDILPEQKEKIAQKDYGGSMRLGSFPAVIRPGTRAAAAYRAKKIEERHRHRFEINPDYVEKIISAGGVFSGTSPDGRLMEIFELPAAAHPFFVGTQFHPELKSRPLSPHPLFRAFLRAAKVGRRLGK